MATTSWPATLRSESYAGGVANYSVPVSSYSVSVTGTSGPVWVVMKMGAASTLEYQGRVAQGASLRADLDRTEHGVAGFAEERVSER